MSNKTTEKTLRCPRHPLYNTVDCPICTVCSANKPHVCPYCGLNAYPYAYHERGDCQSAMLALTARLRQMLSDRIWYLTPDEIEELEFVVGYKLNFTGVVNES